MIETGELVIQKLQSEMNDLRANGENVTLRQHLDTAYPEFAPVEQRGHSWSLEKYFREMEINFNTMTTSQMIGAGVDRRLTYLFEEFMLEALYEGLQETDYTNELIAYTVTPSQPTAVAPLITAGDKKTIMGDGEEIPEGAEFTEVSVKFGKKSKDFGKYGKKLPVTYEAIQDMSLPILAIALKGIGSQLFVDRQVAAIKTLINGDKCRGTDGKLLNQSTAVIGVDDSEKGLTFLDIDRACMRLGNLGRVTDKMACREAVQLKISQMDEFKKREQGIALYPTQIKGNYQIPKDRYTYTSVPDQQLLIFSQKYAMIELRKQALFIETNRIPERQIENTIISMRTTFMTLFRDARILIDESKSFSTDGFPSWMEPLV